MKLRLAIAFALCLLLTLLAVPVFYSLFEDLAEARIFRRFRTQPAIAQSEEQGDAA